mmetsp:Transcript_12615/g.19892  ORF Transcript_12615/g.19892 Transcript_12615/m.19892 type:complete len:289 (+) Transcript_12615:47-913(+)
MSEHSIVVTQSLLVMSLSNKAAVSMDAQEYDMAHQSLTGALISTKRCLQLLPPAETQGAMRNQNTRAKVSLMFFCSFRPTLEIEVAGYIDASRRATVNGRNQHETNATRRQDVNQQDLHRHRRNVIANSDDFFLFRNPMRIDIPRSEQQLLSSTTPPIMQNCIEIVSVAVIYNLALCQHLFAIDNEFSMADRSSLLQRAITLYNQAACLLASTGNGDRTTTLTLALWNNLGHAYSALLCPEKARLCFGQLAVAIANYAPEEESEDLDTTGFVSNVMSLALTCNTAVAA